MTIEQIIAVLVAIFGGGAGIAVLVRRIFESVIEKIRAETKIALVEVEAEAKKDSTITDFSVEFNAERKQLQQSINHLQAENFDIRLAQAEEKGRLIEFKEAMERERSEWKAERAEWKAEQSALAENYRKQDSRILELEKNERDRDAKIKELTSQIDILKKQIADKDGEIVLLKATLLQLETERAQLLDLNTELRKQVDERNARIDNLSLMNQRKQEAETPPVTSILLTDNTTVIPDMSADDTVTPLPANTEDNAA